MFQNQYFSAEVIEIGQAADMIQGSKTAFIFVDTADIVPYDRLYDWWDWL
jgi:hypothetical protein